MSFYYFFKWLLIILLIIPLFLATFHFLATKYEEKFIKPIGRLVDIGNRRLHLYELGSQHHSPTVILIHGAGGGFLSWIKVQSEVAKFAHVISYDQAGLGWSDESPEYLTSKNSAKDLLKLLENCNLHGPYILVGHSIGAFVIRELMSQAPSSIKEKINSIVFVDGGSEDLWTDEHKLFTKNFSKYFAWYWFISMFGICRFNFIWKNTPFLPLWLNNFPKKITDQTNLFLGWTKTHSSTYKVLQNFDNDVKEIIKIKNNIKNKKLIVLVGGNHNCPFMNEESFLNGNIKLAKLSNQSELIIAKDSGHFIHIDQPEIIIELIRKLVLETKE